MKCRGVVPIAGRASARHRAERFRGIIGSRGVAGRSAETGKIMTGMKLGNWKVEPQIERDLVKLPDDFDYEAPLEKAFRHASNYTVAFILDGRVFGSGTLVSFKEVHGILTAHHVMLVLEKRNAEEFSLCIKSTPHRVNVRKGQFRSEERRVG